MWNFKISRMTMGEFFPGSQEGRPRRRTSTELIRSVDGSMSDYGTARIAMDTTPASAADNHAIADEPHVAPCSDLDAWTSGAFVFLDIAMCECILTKGEYVLIKDAQQRDQNKCTGVKS
jgi:hypothetical protein